MHAKVSMLVGAVFLILALAACTSAAEPAEETDGSPTAVSSPAVQSEPTVASPTELAQPTTAQETAPAATVAVTQAAPQNGEDLHPLYGLSFTNAEGLWRIDTTGAPVLLTEQTDATVLPGGKQVVYSAEPPEGGKADIWLLDLDTGERRNLTNTPDRYEEHPMGWPGQPDRVFFVSDVECCMESGNYPTVVGLDGSGYQVLDEAVGGPYAFSPDGQKLAYGGREGRAKIYTTSGQTETFDPLPYGVNARGLLQPAWSPDGKRLAWKVSFLTGEGGATTLGVAVFDLEAKIGTTYHTYKPVGGGEVSHDLVWSPDGQWLAFVTHNETAEQGRTPNLWVMRADGSEEVKVAPGSNPVWSPDGKYLAYLQMNDQQQMEVWVLEVGQWTALPNATSMPKAVLLIKGWTRP